MMRSLLFLIALFLLLGQKKDTLHISVGNSKIDASFFENYTNEWTVNYFSVEDKLVRTAVWTDVVRIKQFDSQKLFHRVQELYNQTGSLVNIWTNIAEIPSLKPLQRSEFSTNGRFNYTEFSDTKISGSWTGVKKELRLTPYKYDLKEAPFDWTLYGVLLAAIPFEKGLIIKMPFFIGSNVKEALGYLVVEVVKQVKIGQFNTWEMKTNQNLTFWVTKQKPYIINLELKAPNGFRVFWKSTAVID